MRTATAAAATGLEAGPGYAVKRGISIDHWCATDLRSLLWGIGRHLGVAVSQDADARLLAEVGPCRPATCGPTRRTADGTGEAASRPAT